MNLYSIVPPEAILEGYESFKPEYTELDLPGGGKMLVEPLSPTEGRLVRLISPRPQDYLRPEYQPGTIVSFKAEVGGRRSEARGRNTVPGPLGRSQ